MARVFGTSGCSAELLASMRRRGLPDFATFRDVERFFAKSDSIIARARELEAQRLEARISDLLGTARALEDECERSVASRRVELAAERYRLPADLATLEVQAARTPFRAAAKWWRKAALRLRLRNLTRHFEREVQRPYLHVLSEARRRRASAAVIEAEMERSLSSAVKPLAEAKRYLETDGRTAYLGALGEERVLTALRTLPDAFSVFNDVTFSLPKPQRWAEHDEWVQSAQVDHVVVGNDCVFLLETKNWSRQTLESAAFTPQHQVKRANYVVFCLAREWFGGRRLHLRNLVVMGHDDRVERYDPPFEYVTRVPAARLATYIRVTRPRGTGMVPSAEACEWILRFVP